MLVILLHLKSWHSEQRPGLDSSLMYIFRHVYIINVYLQMYQILAVYCWFVHHSNKTKGKCDWQTSSTHSGKMRWHVQGRLRFQAAEICQFCRLSTSWTEVCSFVQKEALVQRCGVEGWERKPTMIWRSWLFINEKRQINCSHPRNQASAQSRTSEMIKQTRRALGYN